MTNKPASLEELLAAIDNLENKVELANISLENSSKKTKKQSKHYKQLCRFIKECNITSGTIRVPIYRMVHEYHKWAEKHDTKPTPYELSKVMREHFKFVRSGAGRYFLVNDFCDMSIKARKSSKTFYKRYVLNKREKNEKKKDETCESQSEIKSTVQTG